MQPRTANPEDCQKDWSEYAPTAAVIIPVECRPEVSNYGTLQNSHIRLFRPSDVPEIKRKRLHDLLTTLPKPGTDFLQFRLLQELGTGSFGRVFLAEDRSLANRRVALKLTVQPDAEPQTLAQLQHTNIMPIYSVHQLGDFRAVCMPFFGACTLADILAELHRSDSTPASGKGLVSTIHARRSSHPTLATAEMGSTVVGSEPLAGTTSRETGFSRVSIDHLEKLSYVDAVLWLGMRLSEGLQHAHERDILHRDLKPANVLLTDEGQPMLLDFNLSDQAKGENGPKFGGTVPYMAPEHLAAFAGTPNVIVDERSDIYALGLILYELLTRHYPFTVYRSATRELLPKLIEERRSITIQLRSHNPQIPYAVEAILQKALEPNPAKRYQRAQDLREDLHRQLNHLPLQFANNPSYRERLRKFSKRNPRLCSPAAIAGLAACTMLAITPMIAQQIVETREQQRLERIHSAHMQLQAFQGELDQVRQQLTIADPETVTQGIESGYRALQLFQVLDHPNWSELPTCLALSMEEQSRLKADVNEILYLLSSVQEQASHRQTAATSTLDPYQVQEKLDNLRQRFEGLDNLRGKLVQASDLLRQRKFRKAFELAKAVLYQEPDNFFAWLICGRCHEGMNETSSALDCYSSCIALRPKLARAYFLRGSLLLQKQRDFHQANADLEQALQIAPQLKEARINRALALRGLQRYPEAHQELTYLIENRQANLRVWFLRAQVRREMNDLVGSNADTTIAAQMEPTTARDFLSRGYSRIQSSPFEAIADFQHAEQLNPNELDAIQNQAYLYGEILDQPEEAIQALTRYLERSPESVHIRLSRAVLHARLQQHALAIQDTEQALRERKTPQDLYQAACVYTLLLKSKPELKSKAIQFLASAIVGGAGKNCATDPDLANLRQDEVGKSVFKAFQFIQSNEESKNISSFAIEFNSHEN